MSRWFRMYDDVLNDPKVQRLPGEKFKAWVNLLCLASKNEGTLPPLADIAYALRMSEDLVSAMLDEFYAARLLDEIEVDGAPMSYTPHNWSGRQFKSDSPNDRVKRFRERKRNVTGNVACNVTSTVTVTPPDTEQNRTDAIAANAAHLDSNPQTDEAELYRRSKIVLGANAGGMVKRLIKAKGGSIPLARSAIEQAATKGDAREYIGAIIRGRGDSPEDLRARGEAW